MATKKQPVKKAAPEIQKPDRQLVESEALARIGSHLAGASSVEEIVAITKQECERLLEWDAFSFAVRLPGEKTFRFVSLVDIVDGQKRDFAQDGGNVVSADSLHQGALHGQPDLRNRSAGDAGPRFINFGDTNRPSASLMYVPVFHDKTVIGIISAQSYTHHKYDNHHLSFFVRIASTVGSALGRTPIANALKEGDITRELDYFVDDRGIEFKNLLHDIEASGRHSEENKSRFKIILATLYNTDKATKQQIQTALEKAKLTLPANPSGFIRDRINSVAQRHAFSIVGDGNAYRLLYQPRAKAIVFFSTKADHAGHLVDILRKIDRSERATLEDKGIWIVEAGGVVGDEDVYCIIEATRLDSILTEVISILQDSQQSSYSRIDDKYLTAADIVQRTKTYPLVPGMRWQRREKSSE